MTDRISHLLYNFVVISSLCLVAIVLVFNIFNNDLFSCDKVVVVGCDYLIKEDSIQNQLSYLKGSSVLGINKDVVRNLLVENQFISEASISVLLPSTLIIDLEEIIPIGMIKLKNLVYILDNKMNSFACSRSIINSIPVIPEIYNESTIGSDSLSTLTEFKLIADTYEHYEDIYNNIKYIKLNESGIEAKVNNSLIYFSNDYKKQLKYLHNFMAMLNQNKLEFNFKYVKFAGENIIVG